jgi:Zn-dependent protease with chaperone function
MRMMTPRTRGREPVRIDVYVPFLVTALLAALAPRPARRLAPRPAAWALACTALVTAIGWLGSLALLALTAFAQIPEVAEEGRWSVSALRAEDPVHLVVAVGSAFTLVAACLTLGVAAVRQARHVVRSRRESARLPGETELAVMDDESPLAFALPGAPGRAPAFTKAQPESPADTGMKGAMTIWSKFTRAGYSAPRTRQAVPPLPPGVSSRDSGGGSWLGDTSS